MSVLVQTTPVHQALSAEEKDAKWHLPSGGNTEFLLVLSYNSLFYSEELQS